MRYFVIAEDGRKYGPADLTSLHEWIGQGRLHSANMLEEELTGVRMPASEVGDLNFAKVDPDGSSVPPVTPPPITPPPSFQRAGASGLGLGAGSQEVQMAWVFAILSLVTPCGIVLIPLAFVNCRKAEAQGNFNTKGPRVLATVAGAFLVLGLVLSLILIILRPSSDSPPSPFESRMPAGMDRLFKR